jgi:ubiquinone/menaquinone biosynthesis C-methylase UbiE
MNSRIGHHGPATTGLVLHWAARYDLLAWILLRGRERAFREKIVNLARLVPGESVLDVGCGTGSLVIAAKQRVGPAGIVAGIDASPEMINRANRKAKRRGTEVVLKNAPAEALPFPDAHFDAVLSTLMLHHLPVKARHACVREIRRVLKPGGRVLAVDFGQPTRESRGLLAHLHRHGHVRLEDVTAMLSESGLNCVEKGPVGVLDLQFVLASVPRNG